MKLIDEKEVIKQAEEKARCFESFGFTGKIKLNNGFLISFVKPDRL